MATDEFAGNGAEMQVRTPGPWEIELNGPNGDEIMVVSATAKDDDGDRIPVADLYRGGYDYSDIGFSLEANARLMATAPELLSMVKRWFALNGEWNPTRYVNEKARLIDETRAIIAKAEGRTNG